MLLLCETHICFQDQSQNFSSLENMVFKNPICNLQKEVNQQARWNSNESGKKVLFFFKTKLILLEFPQNTQTNCANYFVR